jgi:hypothetical protein
MGYTTLSNAIGVQRCTCVERKIFDAQSLYDVKNAEKDT